MASAGQFILLQVLGLLALGVFALALWLLYAGTRRRSIAVAAPERTVPATGAGYVGQVRDGDVADPPDARSGRRQGLVMVPDERWNAKRRRLLYLAVLLLLLVFAGRFVVGLFFASGPAPAERPIEIDKTVLEGKSGAKLEVTEYGAKDGPILLFTHGWGNDHEQWLDLIGALPAKYHIVAWDLPGLGRSTSASDYSLATLADDLDSVVTHYSGRPVVIVGHSIGGMLDLELAKRHPEVFGSQVKGMIEANTSYTNPVLTKKGAERSAKLQKPVFEPLLHVIEWISPLARVGGWFAYESGLAQMQLASDSFTGTESSAQLDQMARYAYRSSPGIIARGTLGMLHWDASGTLPTIGVPTLVIVGNQDTTTLPSAGEHIARTVQRSELVAVDRAAHLGPVEQYQRYAAAIDAFASKTFDAQRSSP